MWPGTVLRIGYIWPYGQIFSFLYHLHFWCMHGWTQASALNLPNDLIPLIPACLLSVLWPPEARPRQGLCEPTGRSRYSVPGNIPQSRRGGCSIQAGPGGSAWRPPNPKKLKATVGVANHDLLEVVSSLCDEVRSVWAALADRDATTSALQNEVQVLQDDYDALEQYGRRNGLRISSIPEQDNETPPPPSWTWLTSCWRWSHPCSVITVASVTDWRNPAEESLRNQLPSLSICCVRTRTGWYGNERNLRFITRIGMSKFVWTRTSPHDVPNYLQKMRTLQKKRPLRPLRTLLMNLASSPYYLMSTLTQLISTMNNLPWQLISTMNYLPWLNDNLSVSDYQASPLY